MESTHPPTPHITITLEKSGNLYTARWRTEAIIGVKAEYVLAAMGRLIEEIKQEIIDGIRKNETGSW